MAAHARTPHQPTIFNIQSSSLAVGAVPLGLNGDADDPDEVLDVRTTAVRMLSVRVPVRLRYGRVRL